MRVAACVVLLLAFSGLATGQIIVVDGGGGAGGSAEMPIDPLCSTVVCPSGQYCLNGVCAASGEPLSPPPMPMPPMDGSSSGAASDSDDGGHMDFAMACQCLCNGAAIPVPATPTPDCSVCPLTCGLVAGFSCSRVDGYVPNTFVSPNNTGTITSQCVANSASGGGSGSTGCTINMDCPFGHQCRDRVCRPFEVPQADCKRDGVSVCSITEECFYGLCVPKRAEVACDPPCRAAYGEVCNSRMGMCVMDQAAAPLNCADLCDGGACRPPLFPGMPVTCTGSTSCVDNAACGQGNKCVQGYCSPCGALCTAVSDSLFAELFNSGFRADDFSVRNATDVANDVANGALSVAANVLMQLDQAISGLRNLDFNVAGGAAAQIKNGQQIRLDAINAAAAGGRLMLGAGSQLRSNLSVTSASGFTLSMAGTVGERALSQFSRLDLSGPLNVAGDENSEFAFPSAAGQSSAQGSGIVQVTGGLRLRGHAGAIPISLGAGDSSAVVDTQLESAGSVLGNKATLVVRGLIAFSGALVEPLVRLHQGATASFRPAASGTLMAGNVSFAADTQSSSAPTRLVINATAAAGQGVVFQHMSNCPAGAGIVYNVEGSADAKVKAGLTLFKYAVSTYANVGSFACTIQVCGDDGNGCVNVANPNTVAAGRRLLAVAAEASFEPNQLTVSGKDTAAAASVRVGVATIAAMVAAVLALIRM